MRAQSTAGNFRNVHKAFDFGAATVEEVDECVEVTDSMAGTLGTVCAADGPRTFTYTKSVGPFPTCGTHTVSNTASYRGADSGATGSASAGAEVNVPCAGVCPLSAGAWKLLASYGGMKADQVARLLQLTLGAPGGVKSIPVSSARLAARLLGGYGSNGVYSSSNGINKLYAQLLAAKLNALLVAIPPTVTGAIAEADAFLGTHDSLSWNGLSSTERSTVLGWASTLERFNTGAGTRCDCGAGKR
jgi:hypothetical protein